MNQGVLRSIPDELRVLMSEQLDAWRRHRSSPDADPQGFMDLPLAVGEGPGFLDDFPPLLQLGGGELDGPPVVVVSLEPLRDPRNFDAQLGFLKDGAETPDLDCYLELQWNFWSKFPSLLDARRREEGTTYFRNLHPLVAGLLGRPEGERFSWDTFRHRVIELPMIPMHARRHRDISGVPLQHVRSLFERRLQLLLAWPSPPQAIVCLGAQAVKLFHEVAAVDVVGAVKGPLGHSFGRNFDERATTTVYTLSVADGSGPIKVALRPAALSNGWQPSREGVHALGRMIAATMGT